MMPSPRVLIVQQGAPGGIGRVELLLQRALAAGRTDHLEVRIVSRYRPHDRFVETAGLAETSTPYAVVPNPLRFVLRSLREAVLGRPDVIVYTHVNVARLHVVLRWLRPRIRTVLLTHGIELWQPLSWAQRFALRQCSRVVTVTWFVAHTLDAPHAPGHAPVAVVPLALSDRWVAGVVPRCEPTGHAVVLAVSRLEHRERQKGIDRLIEAFPLVLDRVPGATLRIVGDGPDRSELEKLAARLGVKHRVEFLGAVDDATLKRQYASADVFALPSMQEGFGLVYLEAMAHGLPCIVAAGTAGAEVVQPGVSGVGVRPDDARELADAVASLLTDNERWSRMSRAAAAAFQERYREAFYGERIRDVLMEAG
jgi:phosphatidylinositol alpha-1,6-mannosyltransferase